MNDSESKHPENNDPEISDNLRRIVPDDLSPAGLVAGARVKRRRRKGMVGALAALALVAVAVPVALNLPTNDNLVAEPAVTSTAPQTEEPLRTSELPGAQACYNDDGTPVSYGQDQSGPAEPGAVKAWLCGDYSPETGAGYVGPIEPLTSGLDSLLEGVQSEPEVDLAVISCPAEYNLSFNVVFEYEDGSRSIVGGDRHGCRLTYDGGVARENADKFYGEAVSAWETQRETDDGDWAVPAICPGPPPLIPWGSDVVQGAICAEDVDGSGGRSAAYLDEDLLKWVMAAAFDAPGSLDRSPPVSTAPQQRYWITLSNEFADHMTFVRHEDGIFGSYSGEGDGYFWRPVPELAARLDEVLANAGPSDTPPAGQPVGTPGLEEPVVPAEPGVDPEGPQFWVSAGCEGVTSEDALNTELPNGELPEGADRIWLCAGHEFGAGIAPPVEALEEPGLISEAVAVFNDLEPLPADTACTMELGPSWLVVHEYADGTKRTVKVEEFGCRAVLSGDTVKVDSQSASYKESLLDSWGAQRAMRDTAQTRPGPLCYLDSALMAVNPEDTTFTSGTACLAADQSDGEWNLLEEKPVPEDLLAQINGQLKKVRPTPEYVITSGDALVLLNSSGDPLRLFRLDDGTYVWNDGEAMNPWTPEGEIAQELTALFER